MQRRTGGPFSRLLASRSPVPADAKRYPCKRWPEQRMDIDRHNFAQVLCARPQLYTNHSTLTEVLAVLTGFEAGNCYASKEKRDRSAKLVWRWLIDNYGKSGDGAGNGEHIALMLLKEYGTDACAIAAIAEFAATLPPAPERY